MGTRAPLSDKISLRFSGGFSLLELLVVVAVLGMCLVAAVLSLADGFSRQEARGAAQDWQAAAAWAQVGALWQNGRVSAVYSPESVAVSHDLGLCGGALGPAAPRAAVTANVRRWISDGRASITFAGPLASPDGGGSLYFHASRSAYRVIIRPESGLTVRSWEAE